MTRRRSKLRDKPPSDPQTLRPGFFPFLEQFQSIENAPYIHPRAVSFRDGTHKWRCANLMPDAYDRDTISQFGSSNKQGKNCCIGFFSVGTTSWVANPDWDTYLWHCFALVIIKDHATSHGGHMVIYDPDPSPKANPGGRIPHILGAFQRSLYMWHRKRGKRIRLWHSTDRRQAGKNEFMINSLREVQAWAQVGDLVWQGERGPRVKNCIEITRH